MSKIWYVMLTVMVVILLCVNGVFYFSTRSTLIEKQEKEIDLISRNIKDSIRSTREAEEYYNQLLSKNLRVASVSIQNTLPPDIKDVESKDLVKLKEILNLKGIALWVETKDNIEVAKSSDPNEVGLKSKSWSNGKWYSMFHQLLNKHDVDLLPGFGEKLPGFWAGPVDTSSVDAKSLSKWGYYNDGTTNYLINPYIEETTISEFNKNAGVEKAIERVIQEYPYLLEISVLNSSVLKSGERTTRDTGVVWNSDKLLVYGSYQYANALDHNRVEEAFVKEKELTDILDFKQKKVLKSYIPTSLTNGDNIDEQLIIVVSSNYEQIETALKSEMASLLTISLIVLVIGILIVYAVARYVKKKEETLLSVQAIYTKNIESLFQTIKEHRHDFNHHVFTILGMVNMKMYEDLERYVKQLSNIQKDFNDIIQVNIPAFSGLLQAKIAKASEKGIVFEHHFENFEKIKLDMNKTTDLVRVIGNILDNGFHAVADVKEKEKKVTIIGSVKNGAITIKVHNNGDKIKEEHLTKIFENGFTTKAENGGSGIGLASSKKIMAKYKGSLLVTSNDMWTTFTVTMPLTQKEIYQSNQRREGRGRFVS